MNNLNTYITEKLKISSKMYKGYSCQPQTKEELREILKERLAKDKNADLNDIDVSSITDFVAQENGYYGLFYGLDPHNIDISKWDVFNATNMSCMFYECKNFTGKGLENWDVSNVKKMNCMFYECENFNSDLSKWNVSNVKKMAFMFWKCKNFNCNLSKWNVSKVEDMYRMFDDCKKFTGEGLENWDVSNAVDMSYMFRNCSYFNCDLNKWNVSNVESMSEMFGECTSLKNIPGWYHE